MRRGRTHGLASTYNNYACRCDACSKAAFDYAKDKRHRYTARAHEALGGKCVLCGSVEGLEADHIDAETKDGDGASLSQLVRTKGWARIERELPLLQLLCHECHHAKSLAEGDYTPKAYRK